MSQRFQVSCCVSALFSLCLAVAATDLYGQAPPAVPAAQLPEPEVLEQGPIHEAFAEPLALQAEAAEIVSRRPPKPIEELPPEYQPEGRNVQWISGYFMWQQELDDFVWVSGFYRDLPPGRTWVPGAWHEVERGHQWAPGFWAEGNLEELQYLPTPPATLEQGPSSPAPGDRYLWAPGCWQWRGIGYAWQPGYWYQAQPDWVWVPSHYTYTPYGCVYVGGYWDFPFALRGLLYAPVYWRGGIGLHVGHYYRPHHVLNTALLVASLFIDHHYHHYYYGYHRNGIHPDWLHSWGHDYGRHGRNGYHDPLWAHHQWNDRHGRGDFDRDGSRHDIDRDSRGLDQDRLVTDVDRLDRQRRNDMKLRRLDDAEQSAQRTRAKQFRQYSQRRAEANAIANKQTGGTSQIRRRNELARSEARTSNGASTEKDTQIGNLAKNRWQSSRNRGAYKDNQSAAQVHQGNRVQQRSNVRQGTGATSNVSPRRNSHTLRSQSPQGARENVQKSTRRTRSSSSSGGGQQATRARSSRSSGRGGGGSIQSRGRGNSGGGGGRGKSGGGSRGGRHH